MKIKERFFWLISLSLVISIAVFGYFTPGVKAADKPDNLISKLNRVFHTLQREYVEEDKVTIDNLITGAIRGMLKSLDDPHSVYLSPEDLQHMRETVTDGTFGGVGMYISKKEQYIICISPIDDTPAKQAGIQAGDKIIKIDDNSAIDIEVDEAVKQLKGRPGTKVKVTVLRYNIEMDFTLTRAKITIPTTKHTMINNNIGYIRITQFTYPTVTDVKDVLKDFKKKKVKSIIVDLRYNPGGLLESVEKICDFFLSKGVIVSTKGRTPTKDSVYYANSFTTIVKDNVPIIVLIDKGSASASEIFAGAMKDTGRGILIGEKSYGKGSVQEIKQLSAVDGYKLTIARYYTPADISIDKVGIEPHIVIKDPELTDDDTSAIEQIMKNKLLDKFLEKKPDYTDNDFSKFKQELKGQDIVLNDYYLKRLLYTKKNEITNNRPIYNLEFDNQLQKAVELLNNNKIVKTKNNSMYVIKDQADF